MKISFIVPVYNVEKYLRECLDSLINQSFSNIEVIAVNDGSIDGSLQILTEYAQRDKRIQIINQKNAGLSAARNTGLKYASGDYILFVDSDDYIMLNSAQVIYDKISNLSKEEYPDIIFFSRYYFKNGSLEPDNISYEQEEFTNGLDTLKQRLTKKCLVASVSAKVFKLEFVKNNNLSFIEGIRYEDMFFTIKTLILSQRNTSIDKYLYVYRLGNVGSITNTIRSNDTDVLITLHELSKIIKSKYPDFEAGSLWRTRMCAWICNATFFKYPIKNFWSKIGWTNCRVIKSDPLFKEYLVETSKTAANRNLRLATKLIKFNLAFFYIIRLLSKKLLSNKNF